MPFFPPTSKQFMLFVDSFVYPIGNEIRELHVEMSDSPAQPKQEQGVNELSQHSDMNQVKETQEVHDESIAYFQKRLSDIEKQLDAIIDCKERMQNKQQQCKRTWKKHLGSFSPVSCPLCKMWQHPSK